MLNRTVLRRNFVIVFVAYVAVVVYVGIVGVSIYAQLNVWGGCQYDVILNADAQTTAWSYKCKSLVTQSIPYALFALCTWSKWYLCAFPAMWYQ